MEESEIVERILGIAENREPDQLLETTVASVHGDLYDAAAEAFGGWDAALAAALCASVAAAGESAGGRGADERIVRSVGPDAEHPIFAATRHNLVFKIEPGRELALTEQSKAFERPPEAGPLIHVHHVGQPEGLVFFSSAGHYYALDPRMVPKWSGREEIRQLGNVLDLEGDEVLEHIVPRRAFYGGRIVHVTEGGKGKASEASEFQYAMDHKPRVAFKLEEDDRAVAVMSVPEDSGIFAASKHGRGIHFPDDELRSMGQRAIGVNVMDLDGESDTVVGAFSARRVEQVALVTEQGLGKRVDFSEFRQQGRAGAGMQLARLNRDDYVAGVAPCRPSDDIVVSTTRGRVHRRPVGDFPFMGRPAKGDQVVELGDDEEILEFARLPCSTESG